MFRYYYYYFGNLGLFICVLDFFVGRVVDGREIMVQLAKYGPNAERMWVVKTL